MHLSARIHGRDKSPEFLQIRRPNRVYQCHSESNRRTVIRPPRRSQIRLWEMFLFQATRLGTVYLDSTMNEQSSGKCRNSNRGPKGPQTTHPPRTGTPPTAPSLYTGVCWDWPQSSSALD